MAGIGHNSGKAPEGRGRLSSIELLPAACAPVVTWANEELRRRDRTQTDIYQEFYAKLQDIQKEFRGELEFTIPSFSSFNRKAIKLAQITRRMDDTNAIVASLAKTFDAAATDDLTIVAGQAIKTLIFEIITCSGEGEIIPKEAMQLASALRQASQAQGISTKRRKEVEKDFEEKVTEAVDKAGAQVGLSKEQVAQIRRDVLGVRS
jgi:hypothetical protein